MLTLALLKFLQDWGKPAIPAHLSLLKKTANLNGPGLSSEDVGFGWTLEISESNVYTGASCLFCSWHRAGTQQAALSRNGICGLGALKHKVQETRSAMSHWKVTTSSTVQA